MNSNPQGNKPRIVVNNKRPNEEMQRPKPTADQTGQSNETGGRGVMPMSQNNSHFHPLGFAANAQRFLREDTW